MGLGDFLKKGAQKLGKAVGHEAQRLGHAVKSTVKEATKHVVDTVKDVVEVGKIVGEKVKGALIACLQGGFRSGCEQRVLCTSLGTVNTIGVIVTVIPRFSWCVPNNL